MFFYYICDTFEIVCFSIIFRLKGDTIRKLNDKLELFGINCNQNTLSNNDVLRIIQFLKFDRDQIADVKILLLTHYFLSNLN